MPDAAACREIAPALAHLLGGDLAIADAHGQSFYGNPAAQAQRTPLILDGQEIGFLSSATAESTALAAARDLLLALLRDRRQQQVLSTDIEARIAARVAEIGERQQALYLADKLDAVGRLAAGMAHEINNPLAFVRSNFSTFEKYLAQFAELKTHLADAKIAWQTMELDFLLEDSLELLRDSAQGLSRIARIIADLKAFSRVDQAVEELADLNECLRSAAAIIEKQLPFGVVIVFRLSPLPAIVCLPGRLNQIFFNIIGNAAQAVRDAGRPGQITISSGVGADGIVIRIADDGVGMSPEQVEHAFEPFYTQRPVGAGLGLGLATARSVVLAHGGRIALASTVGSGTTVTLHFPVPTPLNADGGTPFDVSP